MSTLKEKMNEKRGEALEIEGDNIEFIGTETDPETGEEVEKFVWSPFKEGQEIEGLVLGTEARKFGDQLLIVIEDGRQVLLPAHADLKKKINNVYQFDYVYCELERFKVSDNPEYNDKPIYKLTVIPSDEVPDEYKREYQDGLE
jgi:hypothetical protein